VYKAQWNVVDSANNLLKRAPLDSIVLERKISGDDFEYFAPGSNLRKEDVVLSSVSTSVISATSGEVTSASTVTDFTLFQPAAPTARTFFDNVDRASYDGTVESFTVNARASLQVTAPGIGRVPVNNVELVNVEGASAPIVRITDEFVPGSGGSDGSPGRNNEELFRRRSITPVQMVSQSLVSKISKERALQRDIAQFRLSLNGVGVADILAAIAESPEESSLGSKLVRHAALLPRETVPEILRFLAATIPRKARATMLSALAAAGTEQAQAALVEFSLNNSSAIDRLDALHSFIFVAVPSTASVNRLNKACSSEENSVAFRDTCVLVLGAMLEKTSDEKLASSIGSRWADELSTFGASRAQVVHSLHVLGNMGTRVPVSRVLPFITSQFGDVRTAAVDALRGVGSDPLVRDALASLASNETTTAVLIAIVSTQQEAMDASRSRYESDEAFGIHVLDYVLLNRFGSEDISEEARVAIAQYLRSKKSPKGSLARRGADWAEANSVYDLIASQSSRQADKVNYPIHNAYLNGRFIGTDKINLQVRNFFFLRLLC
jgi:hypothetical protein